MKKYSFLFVLIATLLMSCGKDPVKPTVATNEPTEITATSALCGGEVTNDGGAEVTARGVCWSTEQNPTLENSFTTDGNGVGAYQSGLYDLAQNTTYYVRAYAANSEGTAYGEEKSFTTLLINDDNEGDEDNDGDNNDDEDNGDEDNDGDNDGEDNGDEDNDGDNNGDDDGGDEDNDGDEIIIELPSVATNDIVEITETSAVCGGEVTNDGGAEVIARGVCWSLNQNPTINDSHTADGSGMGLFASNLLDLSQNTTYYVRAYATNSEGTAYGEEKSFTTLEVIEGNTINGYEYVDLGLPSGLKWATCNVGAAEPQDVGSYFAWGELKQKQSYTPDNSATYGVPMGDISGDAQYDVAAASWGSTWRMPTEAEARELKDNCTWEWITVDVNMQGCIVTGPNGNQIYLPAAGFKTNETVDFYDAEGAYWISTPDNSDPGFSYFLYFYNTNFCNLGWFSRYAGLLIRPVSE